MNQTQAEEDFIKRLEEYDFIRLAIVDLSGIHLSKFLSTRYAKKIATGQSEAYSGLITFGARAEPVIMDEMVACNFANGPFKADPSTLYPMGWLNLFNGSRAAEVICNPCWENGKELETSPRVLCQRMLSQLRDEFQLNILSGFEPEFRIFHKQPKFQYTFKGDDYCRTLLLSQFQEFFAELDHHLHSAGVEVQDYLVENGPSQLETPLVAKYGLESPDKAFLFRQIVKEVALKYNFQVSFMTQATANSAASGWHFNHSLVSYETNETKMYDPNDPDKLSQLSRHWLGGLLKHNLAMTALTSPTVNCYRRLHKHLAPSYNSWGINSRFRSIRVKNSSPNSTYFELRTPSSAACPYLVMAATIAAGLDGLCNQIEPIEPVKLSWCEKLSQEDMDRLEKFPENLEQALVLLEKDEFLNHTLGKMFVNWFIKIRRETCLKILSNVDINNDTSEALEAELERYFDFI